MRSRIIKEIFFIVFVMGMLLMIIIKQDETIILQDISFKAALNKANEKYQWKKNRLRTYTDLVYNTKYGTVYEKK